MCRVKLVLIGQAVVVSHCITICHKPPSGSMNWYPNWHFAELRNSAALLWMCVGSLYVFADRRSKFKILWCLVCGFRVRCFYTWGIVIKRNRKLGLVWCHTVSPSVRSDKHWTVIIPICGCIAQLTVQPCAQCSATGSFRQKNRVKLQEENTKKSLAWLQPNVSFTREHLFPFRTLRHIPTH